MEFTVKVENRLTTYFAFKQPHMSIASDIVLSKQLAKVSQNL